MATNQEKIAAKDEEKTGAINDCKTAETHEDKCVGKNEDKVEAMNEDKGSPTNEGKIVATIEDISTMNELKPAEKNEDETLANMKESTMATSHTEYSDTLCTLCRALNKLVTAFCYCVDCETYLCRRCDHIHKNIPYCGNHYVLPETDKDNWGKQAAVGASEETSKADVKLSGDDNGTTTNNQGGLGDVCKEASATTHGIDACTDEVEPVFESCQKHNGEWIDMYCENHDALCCSVCVSYDHKACQDVHNISLLSENISSSHEVLCSIQIVMKLVKKLQKFKESRQESIQRVRTSKSIVLDEIEAKHVQAKEALEEITKRSKNEVKEKTQKQIDKLEDHLCQCETMLYNLELVENELYKIQSKGIDTPKAFSSVKSSQAQVAEAEKCLDDVMRTVINDEIKFTGNAKLFKALKEAKDLGDVDMRQSKQISKKTLSRNWRRRTVQYKRSINVKLGKDGKTCSIAASCLMPEGYILLADCENQKMKMLNTSYEIISTCNLSGQANDACMVHSNRVAVALVDSPNGHGKVQYVKIIRIGRMRKMICFQSFKVDHYCAGVDCYEDNIYVTDSSMAIMVYSIDGKPIKKFFAGLAITSFSSHHLVITKDGQRYFVAGGSHGLIIVSGVGDLVSQYKADDLTSADGICLDDGGNVYVGDSVQRQVLLVNSCKNDLRIGIVVPQCARPRSVAFEPDKSILLVSTSESDVVQTFDIK